MSRVCQWGAEQTSACNRSWHYRGRGRARHKHWTAIKEETDKVIRSLKKRKTPGQDNLDTELFRVDPVAGVWTLQSPLHSFVGRKESFRWQVRGSHSKDAKEKHPERLRQLAGNYPLVNSKQKSWQWLSSSGYQMQWRKISGRNKQGSGKDWDCSNQIFALHNIILWTFKSHLMNSGNHISGRIREVESFFLNHYLKTIVGWGFCDLRNNQGRLWLF